MKIKIKSLLLVSSIYVTTTLSMVACSDKQTEVTTPTLDQYSKNSERNNESTVPADAPTFIFAVEKSYPPFIIQDENGLPSGFDMDLIYAIAEKSQFHVDVKAIDWSDSFDGLQKGKYDVLGSGVNITDERKMIADFSTPYFESRTVFATTSDNINSVEDMSNKTIAIQQGVTGSNQFIQDTFGNKNTLDDYETLFLSCQAMIVGKADTCVGDVAYLQYLKESLKDDTKIPDIKLFEANSHSQDSNPLAFAVKKDNSELLALVNSGLEKIKQDGTFDEIHNKWFGE